MSFVHLHVHSHYSLLDGLGKPEDLVARAKELGMPALALTDHGAMYGLVEFYQACQEAEIKPILGAELYIAPNGMHNKRPKVDERPNHLVLLARNYQGYQNLLKLTSLGHLEGFYYKPRIDLETLKEYSEGLIATSACIQGEVGQAAINHGYEKAKEVTEKYLEIFSKEDFILEVQHNSSPDQDKANEIILKLGKDLGLLVVATNDVHYINEDDAEAQDILVCIQTKKQLADKNRLSMQGDDYSFKTETEMKEWFKEHPEVVDNTLKVAERCQVDLPLGQIQLPAYDLPEGITADEELARLCQIGLKKRYQEITPAITKRLKFELEVITKTGYASYFLIVQDFVNWAKNNGIVVGPGRGSAAGSLVAYLTQITNIDPIKYDLLFERFLNPARISMPDIDLDFADIRREEVINYVEKKYGKDRVSQIITFGTMAARAAVRDVGRVLGLSYGYCDKIAKLIPMFTNLDDALQIAELKEIYDQDLDAQRLLDRAKKLEGVARHCSVHACGILITKDPLTKNVPLQYASQDDKSVVSQYSLHPVEDLGLLKMDFLGLKNLTIIEQTIYIISKTVGREINIDNIPLDDKKAYQLLRQGTTTGVFQLESSGMRRYLKELKPTELEDIIAMVALYRPGPMEWIPDYIAGKQGKKKPTYLHPTLKPILDKTYGVAIYQEQVMQIARDLAGFSLGEADVLRKAVGKKIKSLLEEQKEKFIQGCVDQGVMEKVAKKVFEFIEPFAGYGFNRSHAACYALIAYITAYLKANYPAQFMAALMTADFENTERIALEVGECENLNIEVLPPDINESFSTFTVVKESLEQEKSRIRFGLAAIKNVGQHIVRVIIDERKADGHYKNLEDFLSRVQDKDLNKKSLESLIKSGALDAFGERGKMLANIENLLNYTKQSQQEKDSGQTNLFGQMPVDHAPRLRLAESAPASEKEKLAWEKELMGLYISSHPLAEHQELINQLGKPLKELKNYLGEEKIKVVGVITGAKKILTRKGQPMLFAQLEDSQGQIEAVVFPKILEQTPGLWEEDKILVVEGKVNDKDGEIKILVDTAREFDPQNLKGREIAIQVPKKMKKNSFEELKQLLINNPGNHPVYLVTEGENKIDTKLAVNPEVIKKIEEIIGRGSVNML